MSFIDDFMLRFRPKKGDAGESSGEKDCVTKEVHTPSHTGGTHSYAEFITPACHYNEDTLLNKSGGLVQIIQIEDYAYSSGLGSLRDAIRTAIANVQDPGIAFWVYTVREECQFELDWRKTQDFSDSLHSVYRSSISSRRTYANEVYIAVVTQPMREGLERMVSALTFGIVKKRHKSFLASKVQQLSKVTSAMVAELQCFSARRLGVIRCDDGRWRSELLEFLGYLVTLRRGERFLESRDSAHTIAAGCGLTVGFNTLKVSDESGSRYGAVLGVKEYAGESLDAIDMCLQQECEFVITEVIQFVPSTQVKDAYRRQAEMLEISGDAELAKIARLEEIMSANEDSIGDCCKRKVSCMIISNSVPSLKKDIKKMVAAFSALGAIVVRVDLALEDDFWANMPGGFRYVLGMRFAMVKAACTFAMTHHFPSGALKGGRWQEAITLFFSNQNLPYFFGFHAGEKGHTLCLGPQDSHMTLLINFIISESRRLRAKSVVFDYSGKSIIFATAINGQYNRIDDRQGKVTQFFNPFNVHDTQTNREIAVGVVERMASPLGPPSAEIKLAAREVVDRIFSIPVESRTPEKVRECIEELGGAARAWGTKGAFAHLISGRKEMVLDAEFLAINVGMLAGKQECIGAVLYFLLRSLESRFNGEPTILVMYEAWIMDVVFPDESEFDAWMERLTALNVVVVFAAENMRAISASKLIRYASKHIETRIFMPNVIISSQQHIRIFGLSKEEVDVMLQIPHHEGHFFIKQGNSSVVLELKLQDKETRVLSANRATIKLMYEAVAEKGKDWLPAFHAKCDKVAQQ
ncbi:type IV secretion system protein VirB4 [Anaplasma centrale str. Israel]|uniref:Type IV secretion system protein VirB4 n=1 Tax=Anaplasma centrale (strain Israel) TaxID=574556 RepID=D1ATT7_ANACI|nr:VirB4 family type IV secretion system protein [Anaplasma centrale]ACZ48965.1 type IV secretion system protein VirB4 [Anaplasma centrale str. Israel]